jgi:hypothetical protein
MQRLRKALAGGGQGKYVLLSAIVLAVLVSPFAFASGEGSFLKIGKRNPAAGGAAGSETEIIANSATYGTRQSNLKDGDGGGAIYGCRSAAVPAPGKAGTSIEPCIRGNNLKDGRAFEFNSVTGTEVGRITVGNDNGDNPSAKPFTTNATGVATGLNADRLDGKSADDLVPLRADVNGDGSLSRGTTGTTSSRPQAGVYNVVFPRDITQCTPVATVGSPGAGNPARAFIDVGQLTGNTNGLSINVQDSDGTNTNRPFHVIVVC